MREHLWYLSFCARLISLSTMSSSSIQFATNQSFILSFLCGICGSSQLIVLNLKKEDFIETVAYLSERPMIRITHAAPCSCTHTIVLMLSVSL